MRIPIPCIECIEAPDATAIVFAIGSIDDDGNLTAECENGHSVLSLSPQPNHAWLTTAGALALIDGYHREAASSFAAALESSFAFYVEVSLYHHGLDVLIARELLKHNRQSERRIGMVSVCYLRDTGKQFPFIEPKRIKFRNDVVHNGRWPTRAETIDYADYVCRSIAELYQTLGPALEPYYHYRVGEITLGAQGKPAVYNDDLPFLSFYMKAETIVDALDEFNRSGPHRGMGGGPRLVK